MPYIHSLFLQGPSIAKADSEEDESFCPKNGFVVPTNDAQIKLDKTRISLGKDAGGSSDALLSTPAALPGDCGVKGFILDNVTPYKGSPDFLAPPTERTLRALEKFSDLLEAERVNGILGA
jgi:hypothetical protein